MTLNPVQFGKDVIDQFGRYLQTTFLIADDRLAEQFQAKLGHTLDGNGLLYKGPYIHLNQPFAPGPRRDDLIKAGHLHPAIEHVFQYEALHKHQGDALQAVQDGQHLVLSTGTGSGKTESFLLPIISHCLHLREQEAPAGNTAIIVYPMNALVNDQLDRLRIALAGTGVTFGRYTGETPRENDDLIFKKSLRTFYTQTELDAHKRGEATFGSEALPLPHEECYTQDEIRSRKPRILLTNYAQLEYLLLRDKDVDLFRGAPLQFMVFDEVHTYTGALGSEVACLIRRLRAVAGKSAEDVCMIGTSATVSDDTDGPGIDTEAMTRRFAHRLFGVPTSNIAVVRESYRDLDFGDTYLPPLPDDMVGLLEQILTATRQLQLQTDVTDNDIPVDLVELTAMLCGGRAEDLPDGLTPMRQMVEMLHNNRCIARLSELFTDPLTWEEALPQWRTLGGGREQASTEALVNEMLAYLTLGAVGCW